MQSPLGSQTGEGARWNSTRLSEQGPAEVVCQIQQSHGEEQCFHNVQAHTPQVYLHELLLHDEFIVSWVGDLGTPDHPSWSERFIERNFHGRDREKRLALTHAAPSSPTPARQILLGAGVPSWRANCKEVLAALANKPIRRFSRRSRNRHFEIVSGRANQLSAESKILRIGMVRTGIGGGVLTTAVLVASLAARQPSPLRIGPEDGLLGVVIEGKYGFIDLRGRSDLAQRSRVQAVAVGSRRRSPIRSRRSP